MIAALPKMGFQAVRFCIPVGPLLDWRKGVKHVTRATNTWNPRKVIEHLLVVVILLGLVYVVYWVITEEPRPRYPGIEKLRGGFVVPHVPVRPASTGMPTHSRLRRDPGDRSPAIAWLS